MPRKQKTIHYLYKTTCAVTGRYYVGMHSTCNLDDGYLGSGLRLTRSIRKYGKENHVKEILEFFDTRELLIEAEKRAITEEMLCDISCMNLMSGGTGGFTVEQQRLNAIKSNKKQEELRKDKEWFDKRNFLISVNNKKAYDDGRRPREVPFDWTGMKHSEETKQKMRKSKNAGEANPQFGSMWITNGNENKRIKKDDSIPEGWYKGRI
jgi:hypothetical protein